jgi:hypothetical protein
MASAETLMTLLEMEGFEVKVANEGRRRCASRGVPARRGAAGHRPAGHERLRGGAPAAQAAASRDALLIALTGYGEAESRSLRETCGTRSSRGQKQLASLKQVFALIRLALRS